MLKIRRNVFETNSSSSHSISIKKNVPENLDDYFDVYINENGVLNMSYYDMEFGRTPFEVLIDFFSKCRYALANFGYDDEKRAEIEKIMFEMLPRLKSIKYEERRSWGSDEEEPYYGDIDHQSIGVLPGFLARYNISLKEFLIDPRYIVFIDGDEYEVKENLFKADLLHKDDFEADFTSFDAYQDKYGVENEDEDLG